MKNKAITLILLITVVFTSLVVYGQKEKKIDMYGEIIELVFDSVKPQIEVLANLKIEEEFNVLLENDNEISGILDFIDNSISTLSRENASIMINEFEMIQKKNLSRIEEKFYDSEIQNKIYEMYEPEFDLNKINDRNTINMINDQELRELLLEIRSSGYKVETAEGMFFPIINYEYYQRYSFYVSSDMKEYIEIMTAESNKVPAKDAALVITWDEVLKRALSQEKFIIQYPESLKINDVKDLYIKNI